MSQLTGGLVVEIADLAKAATEPDELEIGKVYAFHTPEGVKIVDLVNGEWAPHPRRRQGLTRVTDVDSFAWLYQRFAGDATEVYADAGHVSVTAVFDGNDETADTPGWYEHKALLQLELTSQWREWSSISGAMMNQEEFANFVEDHLPDIVDPAAATMLEVAQNLQGTQRMSWQSASILRDGTRQLSYVESTEASAGGAGGSMKVPHEIKLGLRVFEGTSDRFEITGRFRYRITSGRLVLGVKLLGMKETCDSAFADVVGQVSEKTGATVLKGVAP